MTTVNSRTVAKNKPVYRQPNLNGTHASVKASPPMFHHSGSLNLSRAHFDPKLSFGNGNMKMTFAARGPSSSADPVFPMEDLPSPSLLVRPNVSMVATVGVSTGRPPDNNSTLGSDAENQWLPDVSLEQSPLCSGKISHPMIDGIEQVAMGNCSLIEGPIPDLCC